MTEDLGRAGKSTSQVVRGAFRLERVISRAATSPAAHSASQAGHIVSAMPMRPFERRLRPIPHRTVLDSALDSSVSNLR